MDLVNRKMFKFSLYTFILFVLIKIFYSILFYVFNEKKIKFWFSALRIFFRKKEKTLLINESIIKLNFIFYSN